MGRGFSSNPKDLIELMKQALNHKGFAFLQVLSPCVSFYDTYDHFKNITKLLPTDHNSTDKASAMKYAMDEQTLYLGLYYQEQRPTFDEAFEQKRQQQHKGNYGVQEIMSKYKR